MFWLTLLAPLVGAALNGLVLRRAPKVVSHLVGVGAMLIAFFAAATTVFELYQVTGEKAVLKYAFDWMNFGDLKVPFEFVIDRLSSLMLLVVTGIGTLIHIYAGGYMAGEKGTYQYTARFFSYLNLFVFMMLLLVLGNNLLVMFVGWEGVGLCSYLLIGYWFEDDANAAAGMKAFLVNRIGDIGFLLGIFLTFKTFGTLSFSELKELMIGKELSGDQIEVVTYITLCLFVGATGKSAQLPLYVWLPDAMAGPTPVSALIHAATMVTAGIYMMTRLNFMFYMAPVTMTVIALVGGLTAFFAATIALVQNDIKKVLAYSTVSQLGYMVLAVGVGAFSASVFHLLTHACFKALLFLGAGSVIVAMHHKQDMREMGGLKKYLPVTHFVFLIGVLAIIGFPGLAGFFSKDEILWKAFIGGKAFGLGPLLWIIGAVTAGMTSFYMVRLLCMTFYGPNRSDHHTQEHLHETSPVMWAPLLVLAFLSIVVGYLGVPPLLADVIGFKNGNWFEHFLEPVIAIPAVAKEHWEFLEAQHSHGLEFGLMGASVAIMLVMSSVAIYLYASGPKAVLDSWSTRFSGLYRAMSNKWYVDEGYFAVIVRPIHDMATFLWKIVDVILIDGLVNGSAKFFSITGAAMSLRMSGSVHRNTMFVALGAVGILIAILIRF